MMTAVDPKLARALLCAQISEFFAIEADLLDARRYDDWLALLEEDVQYRMPLVRNARRAEPQREYTKGQEIHWFDEGIDTLRQRVAQIKTGFHWAEEPPSRISHLVTNVRLLDIQPSLEAPSEVTTSSRFLIYQNRLEVETALFVGKRTDVLRWHESGWKIASRLVHLDQNVLQAKALTTFF